VVAQEFGIHPVDERHSPENKRDKGTQKQLTYKIAVVEMHVSL